MAFFLFPGPAFVLFLALPQFRTAPGGPSHGLFFLGAIGHTLLPTRSIFFFASGTPFFSFHPFSFLQPLEPAERSNILTSYRPWRVPRFPPPFSTLLKWASFLDFEEGICGFCFLVFPYQSSPNGPPFFFGGAPFSSSLPLSIFGSSMKQFSIYGKRSSYRLIVSSLSLPLFLQGFFFSPRHRLREWRNLPQ